MSVTTYSKTGTKATTSVKLDKDVFAVTVANHELLKLAYQAYLANGRRVSARTKTRGEIRGGGRKPWKQKGTGRARFGSSRNPIWRGGGITFGPTGEENYTKKVQTGAKRTAIRQALTLHASDGSLCVIESIESKDGKVKAMNALLSKLGAKGNVLIVSETKDDLVVRATNNLQQVKLVQALYLNVYDLLNADTVIMTKKSVEIVQDWLGKKTVKTVEAKV